jgi:hypothetical protein
MDRWSDEGSIPMNLMRLLQMVWASPWSLIGLLLAPFFDSKRVVDGVLLCEGARWPAKLGWHYRAITFGHVVLSVDRLDRPTFDHELAHVSQYGHWGPLFVPAYLVGSLWAWARRGHYYRDNPFERSARDRRPG